MGWANRCGYPPPHPPAALLRMQLAAFQGGSRAASVGVKPAPSLSSKEMKRCPKRQTLPNVKGDAVAGDLWLATPVGFVGRSTVTSPSRASSSLSPSPTFSTSSSASPYSACPCSLREDQDTCFLRDILPYSILSFLTLSIQNLRLVVIVRIVKNNI